MPCQRSTPSILPHGKTGIGGDIRRKAELERNRDKRLRLVKIFNRIESKTGGGVTDIAGRKRNFGTYVDFGKAGHHKRLCFAEERLYLPVKFAAYIVKPIVIDGFQIRSQFGRARGCVSSERRFARFKGEIRERVIHPMARGIQLRYGSKGGERSGGEQNDCRTKKGNCAVFFHF